MPCYDKKLEAVRPDFTLVTNQQPQQESQSKEVDTVLATHELIDLFVERGIDIASVEPYGIP